MTAPRLTPDFLLQAYGRGYFPMAGSRGEIRWYWPDPRAIFPLDAFHIPRSLAKVIRNEIYDVTVNEAFGEVIQACAERPEGTWISRAFIETYTDLHRRGFAHSVEAWMDGELAGGLYGVAIGGAFMGESMFHRRTDASKVALVFLVNRLREREFHLLDTQFITPHLEKFGAIEIPRDEYLRRLADALARPCRFD